MEVAPLVAGQAQPLNNTFLLNCCQADNFGRGDSSEKMLLPCQKDLLGGRCTKRCNRVTPGISELVARRLSSSAQNHRNPGYNLAEGTRNEFRHASTCFCLSFRRGLFRSRAHGGNFAERRTEDLLCACVCVLVDLFHSQYRHYPR